MKTGWSRTVFVRRVFSFIYLFLSNKKKQCLLARHTSSRHNRTTENSQSQFRHVQLFILLLRCSDTEREGEWTDGGRESDGREKENGGDGGKGVLVFPRNGSLVSWTWNNIQYV